MTSLPIGKCRQQICTVEKDGKCLEGFTNVEQCPNYFVIQQEVTDEKAPSEEMTTEKTQVSGMVELPDGADLDPDTATRITRCAITRLIVLAGAVGSGKTTLLTSIYESLQWSSFAGYIFAGSQTLPGFERRCHLARIASDREKADTERTKPGPGYTLLHLRVRVEDLSRPGQDLLLSDLSGEIFRLAKDSTEECQQLGILKRADHFALLLDGAKLSRISERQEAYVNGDLLLRSCLDAYMLGRSSLVDVLFTKWDLIEDNSEKSKIEAFVKHIKKEMKRKFQSRVARLRFFRIAARPERPVLPFAYGLEKILPLWVEETKGHFYQKTYEPIEPVSKREFDQYFFRHFGKPIPGA